MRATTTAALAWFDDVRRLATRGCVTAVITVVILIAFTRTAGAQELRGTVLRADSITPASGIVMLLLRETGNATVSRTVTGERGTYVLRAPGVGRYRLRVLRLGHQPMTLGPIALSSGEVRTVPVRLIDAPIQLAQFEVRSASQCRVRPDSGLLVAQLYEEARKALLASVSATSGVESLADYEMFSRLVDRRNRVIAPVQITALARPTTRPFASFPPDSLARIGYVTEQADGTVYRAPDAEVLLSDAFLSRHCLEAVRGTGNRATSIGIAFKPIAASPSVVDIRGTMWLDRTTATLQSVEYTYEPLSEEFARAGVGGVVEFTQTAIGFWFVNRWSIRMPRTAMRRAAAPVGNRQGPPPTVLVVEGLHITGGEVRRVRVDGVVRYAGAGVPRDSVDALAVCRMGDTTDASGLVRGRITDDQKRGVGGAAIVAEWKEEFRQTGTSGFSWRTRSLETTSEGGGIYVLCGVPFGVDVAMYASGSGRRSRAFTTRVTEPNPSATLDFTLGVTTTVAAAAALGADTAVSPSTASLRLRVLQGDSVGVAGAEVTVKSRRVERIARTDSSGRVRVEGLDTGVVDINVRRIGFAAQSVQARIAAGENALTVRVRGTAVVLDEMRVIGNRPASGRYDDLDLRIRRKEASAVVTREEIAKRNPIALSQMLRRLPGVRIADSLGNSVAISTRGKKFSNGAPVDCVLRVMLDGTILSSLLSIDNTVPNDVYAIELFLGPARIPPQLAGIRDDAWCGLIAIWTRGG